MSLPNTIVVSPLRSNEPIDFGVVTLELLAKDTDFVGYFDVVEIWRSRSTFSGPYEEMTSDRWRPARLPKTGGDQPASLVTGPSVALNGKTLELVLKEKDTIAITFVGPDPITFAQAASQIDAQSAGRLHSYVDTSAQLVIETMEPGTAAALRVLPSEAASTLALPLQPPDDLVFGKDARIALTPGVNLYLFTDGAGSTSFFYRTRFRNRSTGSVSEFSLPFSVGQVVGVNPLNLACGYLDLIDLQGRPLVSREVSLSAQYNGTMVDGKSVLGNALSKLTDAFGHIEFTLVRGMQYELSIAGSNLVKTILVPTDPAITSFPLLDPDISEQQDYFRVRIPQIPTLLSNV